MPAAVSVPGPARILSGGRRCRGARPRLGKAQPGVPESLREPTPTLARLRNRRDGVRVAAEAHKSSDEKRDEDHDYPG
eukprot:scaffold261519_cov31-Prasinocladus_malaysianus.AAC.1